ncbi:hypothetical protein LWI28_004354 [Acer negundo]|uniref:Mannose-1-phosphate guanyltransferase C-terminal domain-containing protein n=1 Tax=Acer negundo TaxID=4023 RepID=A0AAD5J7G2_ACENE|nr:hypothetical protein LWI28_004354 [Acer negundo]
MAVNLKRYSVFYSKKKYTQDFLRLYNISAISGVENPQDFQKWHNGGGTFHQSACIDPTVLIEVGAIVHSKALLGANVCIGSGAVVGPSVTIGQSTKIGYNVALSNCIVGDSCAIHNGVCIGQDGENRIGDYETLGGRVAVRDHVSIASKVRLAANCCVTKDITEPGDYGGFPAVRTYICSSFIAIDF